MNINLLQNIDIAICSTLDKRYKQAIELQQKAKTFGLDVELYVGGDGTMDIPYGRIDTNEFPPVYQQSIQYPTWYNRPNNYNAFKCHKDMFQKAIDQDAQLMLMLEDDAQFEDDFLDVISTAAPFLETNEWDMCYLGCYINKQEEVEGEPNVLRLLNGGGTHGVLIKRNILDWAIKLDPIGPFDWIFSLIQPEIKCYCIHPSIITQKSGFSYIEGGELTKPDRYNKGNG